MSDSLRSLMTKEQLERFALFHQQIALLLFGSQKNKRFARKTDVRFPTLLKSNKITQHIRYTFKEPFALLYSMHGMVSLAAVRKRASCAFTDLSAKALGHLEQL